MEWNGSMLSNEAVQARLKALDSIIEIANGKHAAVEDMADKVKAEARRAFQVQ